MSDSENKDKFRGKRKRVAYRMPQKTVEQIDAIADRDGINKVSVIVNAVEREARRPNEQ